jgi:hypothetical protein
MNNVAADPKYAKNLRRLDERLMADLKRTADPRAHGRGDVFDSYPYRQ